MPVHHVHQIEVTVDAEIGVERETEHTEITPATDFLADVNQQRPGARSIFLDPDSASSFPNVHPAVVLEPHADAFIPVGAGRAVNDRFTETGGKRRGATGKETSDHKDQRA